jgi:iron complex outermembrane receptor protein
MAVKGVNTPTEAKKKYSGVLPAFNAVLEVSDQFQIRAAAAQNINRPSLAAYAMNGTISVDGANVTVSTGNPNLNPTPPTNSTCRPNGTSAASAC